MEPDITLLERTVTALNISIDNWHFWLNIWTGLVVIGLLLEYGREIWHLATTRPLDKQKAVVLLGGILITVGVAGELTVQFLSDRDEKLLSSTNEKLIHLLEVSATTAKRDIESSRKETALANKAAAQAQEKAADAIAQAAKLGVSQQNLHDFVERKSIQNKVATAELKQATLKLTSAKEAALAAAKESKQVLISLKRELDAEKQARDKFAKMVDARVISSEAGKTLMARAKFYAGQQFEVTTFWDLKEPMDLSNRLYRLLLAAGWKYIKPTNATLLISQLSGIQVFVHPDASFKTQAAANCLIDFLNENGLNAVKKEKNAPGQKDEKISINVGTKN